MTTRACIVLATDSSLFDYAKVLLKSIDATYIGETKLDVIVLVPKELLIRQTELDTFSKLNVLLRYPVELDDLAVVTTLTNMYKGTSFPIASAYRYFMATACPEYDKAIYIDIDCVVARDISPALTFDLGAASIAAFQEIHLDYMDKPSFKDKAYFNSGVIIANLKKWRELKIQDKLLATSLNNKDWTGAPDQDVFNIVFRNDWTPLSANFNYLVNIYVNLVMPNPIIVHFAGGSKPWKANTTVNKWKTLWKQYSE